MRKTIRTALAATAVVGLLAIPAAGAGAADTNVNVTLSSVEATISITAPVTSGTTTVDLGDIATGAGVGKSLSGTFTDGTISGVTVADTSTGLIRTSTTTVTSGIGDGTIGLCQGSVAAGAVTCSTDANTSILATNVLYSSGTVTTSGSGSLDNTLGVSPTLSVPTAAPLGTASVVFTAAAPGSYEATWSPSFSVTLLGTELAGEYYGEIVHTVTAATVGA